MYVWTRCKSEKLYGPDGIFQEIKKYINYYNHDRIRLNLKVKNLVVNSFLQGQNA
ncbi:hypothetical protein [Epilithonimonas sp.]|uniref:hypothetical protein n=1 Tax=Epilithonimonas sp. TaxID=2894511 RepID=UPI003FA583A4